MDKYSKGIKIAILFVFYFYTYVNAYANVCSEDLQGTNLSNACQLKARILALAETYRGELDQDGSKREQLDKLIHELLAVSKQPPIEKRLKHIQNGWEQVWGPYDFDGIKGFELDANNMYQIILADGYYYNIGFSTYYGREVTGFVRGEYKVVNNKLQVKFTDNKFLLGFMPSRANLTTLALLQEAGFISTQDAPGGISGTPAFLSEVYTDETLRITYGGRSHNDADNDLYILKRIDYIK